jgi:hypothetical protein
VILSLIRHSLPRRNATTSIPVAASTAAAIAVDDNVGVQIAEIKWLIKLQDEK